MSCFILEVAVAMVTDSHLLQVHYNEFIPQFEKQYPEFPWSGVQVSLGLCQVGAVEATASFTSRGVIFPLRRVKMAGLNHPLPCTLDLCVSVLEAL